MKQMCCIQSFKPFLHILHQPEHKNLHYMCFIYFCLLLMRFQEVDVQDFFELYGCIRQRFSMAMISTSMDLFSRSRREYGVYFLTWKKLSRTGRRGQGQVGELNIKRERKIDIQIGREHRKENTRDRGRRQAKSKNQIMLP